MGRSCNFTDCPSACSLGIPPGVTGLLPSRGASDCACSAQFELELAAKVRNRCSGIVMDLKKCFNNIRWICGLYFPQRNWSAH